MSKLHKEQLLSLVEKYLEGNASTEEAEFVEAYYQLLNDGPDALNLIDTATRDEIQTHLKLNIDKGIQMIEGSTAKHWLNQKWTRAIAAVAAIILIISGIYLFNDNKGGAIVNIDLLAPDIVAGKQSATLTLANGKKINLSDAANGELATEAGVVITKSANGQLIYELKGSDVNKKSINTLSTARGETYQIRLPDGSDVWLNAASSLTYTSNLIERGKRMVKINGEAYFEISKDKNHPFVVESKGQIVEVLGTHFNVCSYDDQDYTKTTLLSGSININGKLLKPNQQATLTVNGLRISEIDVESAIDWKNGKFICENTDLQELLSKIARWYDVKFDYDKEDISKDRFTGMLSKTDDITILLRRIALTGEVGFIAKGRIIKVLK